MKMGSSVLRQLGRIKVATRRDCCLVARLPQVHQITVPWWEVCCLVPTLLDHIKQCRHKRKGCVLWNIRVPCKNVNWYCFEVRLVVHTRPPQAQGGRQGWCCNLPPAPNSTSSTNMTDGHAISKHCNGERLKQTDKRNKQKILRLRGK